MKFKSFHIIDDKENKVVTIKPTFWAWLFGYKVFFKGKGEF